MIERTTLEAAMQRALDISLHGPAHDRNPQVGCVILSPEGRIVAEGWHQGTGSQHAEVDALARLPKEWRDRGPELTAVVTLEPCNHTGHTGPCAQAIIDARIGTVVYAIADPGDRSGGGAETLRRAGTRIIAGVLAAEAQEVLGPWLARQHAATKRRPHVTVKWAQTLDGRAAAADGSSQWITGPEARADVHRRRAQADAILIGTGTLLADNPSLTARDAEGGLLAPPHEQPIPVVLGRREIPEGARVLQHPAIAARRPAGVIHLTGENLAADLAELSELGLRRLFVEGGPTVASAFIAAGFADELLVYVAPTLLGGPQLALGDLGISSITEQLRLHITSTHQVGEDLLIHAVPTPHTEEQQ